MNLAVRNQIFKRRISRLSVGIRASRLLTGAKSRAVIFLKPNRMKICAIRMSRSVSVLSFLLTAICPLGLLHAQPSIEPVSPQWSPIEILAWSSATDASAPYNRSSVPLATRLANPALNVNSNARYNEAKVNALIAFNNLPAASAQGTRSLKYYPPTYWQYFDTLSFWGASNQDTRTILTPSAHVVDAAHRNGVPVYGKVFFRFSSDPADLQIVKDFLVKSGNTFPVADKMIEAANYYGFDGWFINQETTGTTLADANDMLAFLKYFRAQAPNLKIMWYDAMVENGSRAFQNEFNSQNDGFLKDGTALTAHEMFLNFWWGSSFSDTTKLPNSRTRAISQSLNPYDIYAGIDTEGSGSGTFVDWNYLFPAGQPHRLSLGIFRPEQPFNTNQGNTANFYTEESRYWVGQNANPANTATASAWKGIANYIPAKSPITTKPFMTSFNTGHGTRFMVNGAQQMTGEWTNLSLQDFLPTWRWIVESAGTKLVPALDFSDAYYGGASLRVTGTLNTPNVVKLYQTNLPVVADTKLQVVFKRSLANTASAMEVGISFTDAPNTYTYFAAGTSVGSGWNTVEFPLSVHAGKTVAAIALRFSSVSAIGGYDLRVGRLAVFDGVPSAPAAPSAVVIDATGGTSGGFATARVRWTHSPSARYGYNIYKRNPNNSRTWLGSTPNNVFFVPEIARVGSEAAASLEIDTIGQEFLFSAPVVIGTVPFPSFLSAYYPFENGLQDNSGNGQNGTVTNAPIYTAGRVEQSAITFNGTNSATIPGNPKSDFTISFWVKTTATGGTGQWYNGLGLVDGEVSGVADDLGISLVGAKVGFGVGNADITILSTTSINNGNWHHVAATRDAANGVLRLYVNGVLEASATGPVGTRAASSSLALGRIQAGGNFFTGSLDELRLYGEVLTAARINKLANQGDSLLARLTFDGTAADASAFGNGGTATDLTYVSGRVGTQAGQFNGTTSAVLTSQPLIGNFSIAFWMKTTATGGTGQWYNGRSLIDGDIGGPGRDFGVSLLGNNVGFGIGDPDVTIASTAAVNDGAWHHVTATRGNAGVIRLYVDGALQASGTGPALTRISPASLQIGRGYTGAIDDLRFYGYELPTGQISSLVNDIPTPWQPADIGSPAVDGYAFYQAVADQWTVGGGGAEIFGASDQFHFVSQPLTGDGTVVSRIISTAQNLNGTRTAFAKTGVMFRTSTAANSAYADVVLTETLGLQFHSRSFTGGAAIQTGPTVAVTAPFWVRLVRSGNSFTAAYATAATPAAGDWTVIGTQTLFLGTAPLAGLAVSSHDNTRLSSAIFGGAGVVPLPRSPIELWRNFHFLSFANAGDGVDDADPDNDGAVNLLEFALGTNPKSGASGPIAVGGPSITPGMPTLQANGPGFLALLGRRIDYVAAGLSYTVEFSPDLAVWEASADVPTLLADDGVMQAVTLPFPALVDGREPRFFRVRVEMP
jgi:endo-beta-N-acetylglucosaminidase D